MAGKSNAPKRSVKKPPGTKTAPTPPKTTLAAPPKSAPAAPKAVAAPPKKSNPQPAAAFYVQIEELKVSIASTPPQAASKARQFASFEEAKTAAIESLVEAIERAELQLVALKQAGNLAGLASD